MCGGNESQTEGEKCSLVRVYAFRGSEHCFFGFKTDFLKVFDARKLFLEGFDCQFHEIRMQCRDASLHQPIVHIAVGAVVVLVDEARFGRGVEFLLERVGGEMSQEIGNRGRWNEGGSTLEIAIFKGFSDLRRTHHLAIFLHSFNFAHFWQHFAHQFIVVARECIVWLTADEANRGTECGRKVSFENVEVEPHLRVGGIVETFQEVSRERSGGNRVVAAFAEGDRSPTPALPRKGGGFRFYQFDGGLNHRFPLDVREH